jgi:hypothetical protein
MAGGIDVCLDCECWFVVVLSIFKLRREAEKCTQNFGRKTCEESLQGTLRNLSIVQSIWSVLMIYSSLFNCNNGSVVRVCAVVKFGGRGGGGFPGDKMNILKKQLRLSAFNEFQISKWNKKKFSRGWCATGFVCSLLINISNCSVLTEFTSGANVFSDTTAITSFSVFLLSKFSYRRLKTWHTHVLCLMVLSCRNVMWVHSLGIAVIPQREKKKTCLRNSYMTHLGASVLPETLAVTHVVRNYGLLWSTGVCCRVHKRRPLSLADTLTGL